MKHTKLFWLTALSAVLIGTSGAQTWDETLNGGGDAGDLASTAQMTVGIGALTNITGTNGANDVDLYVIKVVDASGFSAEMSADFDTQLWMFRLSGHGIAHNDDRSGLGTLSKLMGTDVFTTGMNSGSTLAELLTAGECYIIGVSQYNRDPRDGANAAIFANSPFNGIHSMIATAGALASWANNTSAGGAYTIRLTGAEYCVVPEPASMAALGAGLIGLVARRRRK